MNNDIHAIIARAVERAPQWLRSDLASKDAGTRRTAEETIASMIGNALANGTGETTED